MPPPFGCFLTRAAIALARGSMNTTEVVSQIVTEPGPYCAAGAIQRADVTTVIAKSVTSFSRNSRLWEGEAAATFHPRHSSPNAGSAIVKICLDKAHVSTPIEKQCKSRQQHLLQRGIP